MTKPTPEVPARCRKVYEALKKATDQGKWLREIDLIRITGQSCAGVKMRELRRLNGGAWIPGRYVVLNLVCDRWGGRPGGYKEFKLNREWRRV